MKGKYLALRLCVIGGVLISSSVFASDGTINFTGTVTETACTVSSSTVAVAFGTIASSSFSAAGDVAAPTQFAISLTDCPASVTSATVKFDGTADTTNSNLLALGSSSTAAGLGVAIYDNTGTIVPAATSSSAYTLATGSNSLDFVARLMSTSATITAGTVATSTDFTIAYD